MKDNQISITNVKQYIEKVSQWWHKITTTEMVWPDHLTHYHMPASKILVKSIWNPPSGANIMMHLSVFEQHYVFLLT